MLRIVASNWTYPDVSKARTDDKLLITTYNISEDQNSQREYNGNLNSSNI
jgi:hypothetical protein